MLNKKKFLSAVVSAMFVFSTAIVPIGNSVANAKTLDGNTVNYLESSKAQIANKIDKTLKDKFATSNKVSFLVKLNDQVDTVKVANDAAAKAKKQGLSAYKTKLQKRSTIVSELKIKSDQTQKDIKTYLESQKNKGNVTEYQSFYIVNGLAVTGTEAVMNDLAAMPEVQSVIADGVEQLFDTTNNAKTEKAASTTNNNTPNSIEPNLTQIGAPQVWALGYVGTGVVVGSIDTGVQWNHPALITKYRGYNASNPTVPNNECNWLDATAGQSTPYDDRGHGTHTMGTMVGSCEDGTNQIGVAPGAKWISVKAFTADGGTDSDLLEAGQWMLAPVDYNGNTHPELAPDIINNSWGGGPGIDDWFRPMVINWRSAGILPEFSAGNVTLTNPGGPGSVATPGSYPESFTTGAVDANNALADFSLRGPSPYGGILKPDVSAPGVNIRSSVPGSGYNGTYSGTSMAGPHVCGTAALLLSVNSSLTVDQIETIIKTTATPRTDSEYPESPNNGYGYGVIDAYRAVSSLTTGIGQVNGHVLQAGNDEVPPTFSEEPVTEAYTGMNLPIGITAQDDVSITTVELQYIHNTGDEWIAVAATRIGGDYKGGYYTATIPAAEVTGTSLQYRWRIVDYGGNEVFSDAHTVTLSDGINVGYFTDFETAPAGWSTGGTANWEWGIPTGGIAHAASGEKVIATDLAGAYANSANMVMEMPPINLPSGSSYLQFKHWYNVETGFDNCYVNISTDYTNWTNLVRYTGNLGADYANVQLDLSAYAGQKVFIRFVMTTDSSVTLNGWFIDDVGISDQSNSASSGNVEVDMSTLKKSVNDAEPSNSTSKETKNTDNTLNATVSGLPLSGRVTVIENGSSVNTNPADGSYNFTLAAGDYNLRAEAYGFAPQTQAVNVARDGVTSNVDFTLNPIPRGNLTGKVTNAQIGGPVENAQLYLIEDAAVAPVYTDAEGNYTINAYEGDYTLMVMAGNFYSQRIEVTIPGNGETTQDIQLRPFIGYSGEIGYDDGIAENARAFYAANNGWGVKMTLPEGKNSAMLTTGIFKFWDANWPNPGGTSFKVAVYDATGADGLPGNMIAGPYDATAIRDKSIWTNVDLSGYGIVVPHDFYLVYIQTGTNLQSPGMCHDENGTNASRSYQLVSGAWAPSPAEEGNVMIRAAVSYEATAPVITTPQNNSYTNNATITVAGTATTNLDVHIFVNDKEVTTATPDANGNFSADITLDSGNNTIKAYTASSNGHTDYSNVVNVVLDATAPDLVITSPVDNFKTVDKAVTVEGTIAEANLESIIVNGINANVKADGTWSAYIVLNSGLNTITAVATDKATNTTTKTITVDAKFAIQEITNLKPDQDVNLTPGKSVTIEFDCEAGLKAVFTIHMPIGISSEEEKNNVNAAGSGLTEISMTETAPGHYVGTWTASPKVKASGATIEVKVTDLYGNSLTKYAAGKIYIKTPSKGK